MVKNLYRDNYANNKNILLDGCGEKLIIGNNIVYFPRNKHLDTRA